MSMKGFFFNLLVLYLKRILTWLHVRHSWCLRQVRWEFNSFLMETLSFVAINLHFCWPLERKVYWGSGSVGLKAFLMSHMKNREIQNFAGKMFKIQYFPERIFRIFPAKSLIFRIFEIQNFAGKSWIFRISPEKSWKFKMFPEESWIFRILQEKSWIFKIPAVKSWKFKTLRNNREIQNFADKILNFQDFALRILKIQDYQDSSGKTLKDLKRVVPKTIHTPHAGIFVIFQLA